MSNKYLKTFSHRFQKIKNCWEFSADAAINVLASVSTRFSFSPSAYDDYKMKSNSSLAGLRLADV